MSRVKYAYATVRPVAAQASAAGIRGQAPLLKKIRDRSWLRSSLEGIGLFLFGFGSTGLLLHVASGFFPVSGGASFLQRFYL